ncbi:MAG: hypothetical protein CVT89_01115 [Candidatus Altiarchaeales archaeon HGW-Altiarchaeales-2]|nr:MAG: hypothetical protein CVT89_01115 [Candidatus Altiarchaeales archaeon HGW-Altiarchaeales-2]
MKDTNILIIGGIFACIILSAGLYIVNFSSVQEDSTPTKSSVENPKTIEKHEYNFSNLTPISINAPNETKIIDVNSTNLNNSLTAKFIEQTEKEAQEKKQHTFYSYNQTSKIKFIAGEEYEYEVYDNTGSIMPHPKDNSMLPSHFTIKIVVEELKRTKNLSYFVIHEPKEKVTTFIMGPGGRDPVPTTFVFGGKMYVDEESGELLSGVALGEEGEGGIPILLFQNFYKPWMLYLQKDMRWTEYNGTLLKPDISTGKVVEAGTGSKEYIVKDIEKVNGKECFILAIITTQDLKGSNKKILKKENLWIDTNKRILVKYEWYEDNLLAMGMNLISINSMSKN